MDPTAFKRICQNFSAENLYHCHNCKTLYVLKIMSDERKHLSQVRTLVVIYIMMYTQSQRLYSFGVALSRTLRQFSISEQGL